MQSTLDAVRPLFIKGDFDAVMEALEGPVYGDVTHQLAQGAGGMVRHEGQKRRRPGRGIHRVG